MADEGGHVDGRAVVQLAAVVEVEALVVRARGLAARVGGIGVGDRLGQVVVRREEDGIE